MSIQQTIDYINGKLSKVKPTYHSDSYKPYYHAYVSIQVETDGKVVIRSKTIDMEWYNYDVERGGDRGIQYANEEFYAYEVNLRYASASLDNNGNIYDACIYVDCKNDASKSCVNLVLKIDDETIYNALLHLVTKINADTTYQKRKVEVDPFALKRHTTSNAQSVDLSTDDPNSNMVKMVAMTGGIYEVPVVLNGVLKISFIFDSGASDISISPDVALTLMRTGTIKEADFIGTQKYSFADGSTASSRVFILHNIKIGNKEIKDVKASISATLNAPMLLGQSVLQRFGKFTINNTDHTITIE